MMDLFHSPAFIEFLQKAAAFVILVIDTAAMFRVIEFHDPAVLKPKLGRIPPLQ